MPPPNEQPIALATSVTPEYLKVMGIPLLKGRFFDDHDRRGNEPVVVIDDAPCFISRHSQTLASRQSLMGETSITFAFLSSMAASAVNASSSATSSAPR